MTSGRPSRSSSSQSPNFTLYTGRRPSCFHLWYRNSSYVYAISVVSCTSFIYALFTGPAVKTSSEENTVGSKGASFWCFTSSVAKTSSLAIKFTPLSCSFTLLKLIHLCLEEKNLSIGCWVCIGAGTQQRDTVLKLATLRICLTILFCLLCCV